MTIYLDHNATTAVHPGVLDAMLPFLRAGFGNPSSRHRQGRRARTAIENAREQVAYLVSAHPSQVIFTSGGTEANNLALLGYTAAVTPGRIFVSSTEHASVVNTAAAIARYSDWKVVELGVAKNGLLLSKAIETLQTAAPGDLVSIMLANNETGVIQPIKPFLGDVKREGVIVHSDAVQAAGKIELNFPDSGIHFMSLSAHKIYGPKGVGALVRDKSVPLTTQINGGGHESGLRSGTENVAGIVGFGMAAELAKDNLRQASIRLQELRDRLEGGMKEISGIEIIAEEVERLANTTCFTMRAIEGETMLMLLDKEGISVASGSACSSHDSAPSRTLVAMGINNDRARGALRVSLGNENTQEDVDMFLSVLKNKMERFNKVANSQAI